MDRNRRISIHNAESPDRKALIESGALNDVVSMLKNKRRLRPFDGRQISLEKWILCAVSRARSEPDLAETMPYGERKKVAKSINESSKKLQSSLKLFRDNYGYSWPFQAVFDRLAVEVTWSEHDRLLTAENPMDEDTAHRCRYAVYHLLMDHLDTFFEYVREAADAFEKQDTLIKKPNDTNAERLYFIRTLNKSFCMEFRSPCRSASLRLTSVFYDCEDLDEAALSKLAPYYRPKTYILSSEELATMRNAAENMGEPSLIDDLIEHTKAESDWGFGKIDSGE